MTGTDKPFLLHEQHAGFLDESRRRLKNPTLLQVISLLLVAVVVGGVSVLVIRLDLGERDILRQLEQFGTTTTATIVDTRVSISNKSNTYYITYQFSVEQPDGSLPIYMHEQSVPRAVHDRGEGTTIPIRFLPDKPEISRITETQPNDLLLIVYVGLFLIGVLPCIVVLWRYLRKKRLEREGQVILGKLQSCQSVGVKGGYQVTVYYTFRSPFGTELKGKQSAIRNDLVNKILPRKGKTIAVVYVDDKIHQML